MNFVVVTGCVAVLAGAATFFFTGHGSGAPSQLAGDWRCNHTMDGIESATLQSVARDGATRGRTYLNAEIKGQWVTLEIGYTGRIRVEGPELVEETASFWMADASADGHAFTEDMKATVMKTLSAGSTRYRIEDMSPSRFAFSDASSRNVCERSPVPLKL